MIQEPLFHEDVYDALKHVVAACGGVKRIASALWPEKTMDAASRLLNNSLDQNRPEQTRKA